MTKNKHYKVKILLLMHINSHKIFVKNNDYTNLDSGPKFGFFNYNFDSGLKFGFFKQKFGSFTNNIYFIQKSQFLNKIKNVLTKISNMNFCHSNFHYDSKMDQLLYRLARRPVPPGHLAEKLVPRFQAPNLD